MRCTGLDVEIDCGGAISRGWGRRALSRSILCLSLPALPIAQLPGETGWTKLVAENGVIPPNNIRFFNFHLDNHSFMGKSNDESLDFGVLDLHTQHLPDFRQGAACEFQRVALWCWSLCGLTGMMELMELDFEDSFEDLQIPQRRDIGDSEGSPAGIDMIFTMYSIDTQVHNSDVPDIRMCIPWLDGCPGEGCDEDWPDVFDLLWEWTSGWILLLDFSWFLIFLLKS